MTEEDKKDQTSFSNFSEQRQWEEEHLRKAKISTGAKDAYKFAIDDTKIKEYKMVVGDEVEFVQTLSIPGVNIDGDSEADRLTDAEIKKLSIEESRKQLPVYKFKQDLLDAIAEHQVLVIEGETGSGKTTQIAQYLYEAGYCKDKMKIGVTQPRRVAAMSVAARVSVVISFILLLLSKM